MKTPFALALLLHLFASCSQDDNAHHADDPCVVAIPDDVLALEGVQAGEVGDVWLCEGAELTVEGGGGVIFVEEGAHLDVVDGAFDVYARGATEVHLIGGEATVRTEAETLLVHDGGALDEVQCTTVVWSDWPEGGCTDWAP